MDRRTIRVTAVVVAACYTTLALVLMGGMGAIGLALWLSAPLMIPVVVAVVASGKLAQRAALAVLVGLAGVGAGLLMWGLVWNPGDYNHLVALFLPLYQFAFLALVMAAAGLVGLVRRYAS